MSTGTFYLNVANQWPSFDLHDLAIGPEGSLHLVESSQVYKKRGSALAGPFTAREDETQWFRLRISGAKRPASTNFQIFTYTSDGTPPPFQPATDTPFGGDGWIAAPHDLRDCLILNAPGRALWLGVALRGPSTATPSIAQVQVDYGRDTYLKFLPALYASRADSREFLERLLALFQSLIDEIEGEIDDLPLLWDTQASPDNGWLDWLFGWLAFVRAARWTEAESRQYLAEAFHLYGSRGTVHGLKRYLKIYTGVDAQIEEPGRLASLWSLGKVSTLGFTTMLAPGPLGGAVVGSTAYLDGSRVADDPDGSEMFEDVAHRFCVRVPCAQLNYAGALENVRAVIDREKPAHTVYTLCTYDSQMRVGWQARIGVDSIVATPTKAQLGAPLYGSVLAESSKPCEKEGV